MQVLQLNDSSAYKSVPGDCPLDSTEICRDKPDAHFMACDSQGRTTARCSIWAERLPDLGGKKTGAIGHFAAVGRAAAVEVLQAAAAELGNRNCRTVVGPVDGSTWRPYRLVTNRGALPPFFLEPWNPSCWPDFFVAAGFSPIARYVSEMNDDIAVNQPGVGSLPAKFRSKGVRIVSFEPQAADDYLDAIYDIATEAFKEAFLYTPLERRYFLDMYRLLLPKITPQLVLLATHQDRPVGFVFALPDFLQARESTAIDTIVIKTVAVIPDPAYRGLGRVLIVKLLENAQRLGYRRAISALMHVENRSQSISADCAGPMREYTLFGMGVGE